MKRMVWMLTVVCSLLIPFQSLAMSPYEMDTRFTEEVQALVPYVRWNREVSREGSFVTIRETGRIAGSLYEFEIYGSPDRVTQACLTAPFDQLYMDDASFTDGLTVYNCVYYLMMDNITLNETPKEIFSPYDFEVVVKKGYCYSIPNPLPDGWKWLRNEPGYLEIQRRDYPDLCTIGVHLLNTGNIWFDCEWFNYKN